jgi:sugar lactone lactonase YvrE
MRTRRIQGLGGLALALAGVCAAASPAAARAAATIWPLAGDGAACATAPRCGDRAGATRARLTFPEGVAVDAAGNVYTADWGDSEVRRISADGVITLLAGDGTACTAAPSCGDGGAATAAQLGFPQAVAVDRSGDVYIADTGDNEVRKVSPRGTITRVAGNGSACTSAPACGDGGAALRASLNAPGGLAVDAAGDVYIADTGDNEVRKVSPAGTITRVAGTGTPCAAAPSCGDGGAATSAQLNVPEGLALDARGRLYIVDDGDNEVRTVSARGIITIVAGNGSACTSAPACGDGGAATRAQLSLPEGVAVDRAGDVYIADWGDNRIRVVSRRGTIATAAGGGSQCARPPACGDGGAAAGASLSAPQGVAVDAAGDLYLADTEDHELRLVTPAAARPVTLETRAGKVSLLAFRAAVTPTRVTVGYALSGPAPLSLSVRGARGRPLTVARATGHAGVGRLSWDRRLGGRPAPRGRYQLIVTATTAKASAASSLGVRL